MEERRHTQSFDGADYFLFVASWGLWALAVAWFLSFHNSAAVLAVPHALATPSLSLLLAGSFCSALSKASPKGAWSWWRKPYHLAWCGAFGAVAVAFAFLQLGTRFMGTQQQSMSAWLLVALGGGLAAGSLMTCPGGSSTPARSSGAALGRLFLLVDGGLGLFLCFLLFVQAAPHLGDPLGLPLFVVTVPPLGLWALGLLLCGTDNELIGALPTAILAHLVGCLVHLFGEEGSLLLGYASGAAVLAHCALYLPLGQDPDANPFYGWLRKHLMYWHKLITQPVSGFGDENEG